MADVDPEVERLWAHVLGTAPLCAECLGSGDPRADCVQCGLNMMGAVLADLRERYVLVPREGAEVHRVHQIADRDGGAWHAVAMDANLDPRVPFIHRYRTHVLGPWEVASAPLSAQNGPDDPQGHPDRDDA